MSNTSDVLVIGGGLIGSSIALRLAQEGLRVRVLDRGRPGAEASSAAAGMIAPQGERVEPASFAELCWLSHRLYPDFVAEVEDLAGASVDYRRGGGLLVALDDEAERDLAVLATRSHHAGRAPELLSAAEAQRRTPALGPAVRGALFLPEDHWVDSERLTQAVIESGRRRGVVFAEGTRVVRLRVAASRVEAADTVDNSGARQTFSAARFILAAGCWSSEIAASAGAPLQAQPCRGQMLEFESPEELPFVVRAGHHYLVPRSGRRVAVGTTAEYAGYEKAVTGEGLRSILEAAARLVPALRDFRFRRAWSGLRPDTADHLPALGCGDLANLIFATGHFRNGILLAPVTAQLVSELVLRGSTSHSLDPYRPGRLEKSMTTRQARRS